VAPTSRITGEIAALSSWRYHAATTASVLCHLTRGELAEPVSHDRAARRERLLPRRASTSSVFPTRSGSRGPGIPWAVSLLVAQRLLLLPDPAGLDIANRRIVSRLIRIGTESLTLPIGGYTLRWTFLMSFLTTFTVIPASSSLVGISIPSAA